MKVRVLGTPAEPKPVAFDLETIGLPSQNPCGEIPLGDWRNTMGAAMDAHARIPLTLPNVWSTCPRSSVDRVAAS